MGNKEYQLTIYLKMDTIEDTFLNIIIYARNCILATV